MENTSEYNLGVNMVLHAILRKMLTATGERYDQLQQLHRDLVCELLGEGEAQG